MLSSLRHTLVARLRQASAAAREAERAAQAVADVLVPGPAGVPSQTFTAAERARAAAAVERAKQRWLQAPRGTKA